MTEESLCARCNKMSGYECSCEDWQRADYYEAEVARLTAECEALQKDNQFAHDVAAQARTAEIRAIALAKTAKAERGALRAQVQAMILSEDGNDAVTAWNAAINHVLRTMDDLSSVQSVDPEGARVTTPGEMRHAILNETLSAAQEAEWDTEHAVRDNPTPGDETAG